MLLVGAIRFEGRFCASKKGGVGEVGIFKTCYAHGGCLGCCGMSLVVTGWTISHLLAQMGVETTPPLVVRAPFLVLWEVFGQGECWLVGEPWPLKAC